MRALLTSMALMFVAAIGACGGDDGTANCGAGTVEQNGQCVPAPTTTGGGDTTSSPNDTSSPSTTSGGTDTSGPTVTTDTNQPEVSTECTPDQAGKQGVGGPCTRDCECNQNIGGKALTCYNGPYMEGFRFCTRQIDNTLSEHDGVESITWVSGCLTATDGDITPSSPKIYVKGCTNLDECKQISAAYTDCGSGDLDYAVSASTTECPCWNTSSGGYMSGCAMILKKSCLIRSLPPFNGDYVDDLDDPND